MRHLSIVDQHALDGMDIAIQCLEVIGLHLYTCGNHGLHQSRSHFGYAVGQRAIGSIIVDITLTLVADNLHQCVRQHGLVVFERHDLLHIVGTAANELVVRHLILQDVIAHEHVQCIIRTREVGSRTHLNAFVAIIIIPA